MSITITNLELLNAFEALDKIAALTEDNNPANRIKSVEVDYWLIRLATKVKPLIEDFYKVRDNLIKNNGEAITDDGDSATNEEGKQARKGYRVLPEKQEEYAKELNKLLEQTVEIEGISKKPAKLVLENISFLPFKFKLNLLPLLIDEGEE